MLIACAVTIAAAAALIWSFASGGSRTPVGPSPAASPSSTGAPDAARRPVAVFLGDSYTVGVGTSLHGSGFPAMLGEMRGWEVVNLAISGTGYGTGRAYADVIPDAVAAGPDIVVVSGGRNDEGHRSLEREVEDFYAGLRAALPGARIIATSPLWDEPPAPEWLRELRVVVEREVTSVGGEYVDLGDLFLGRPDLIAPDGLHPDEEGLRLIATHLDELLADG